MCARLNARFWGYQDKQRIDSKLPPLPHQKNFQIAIAMRESAL